MSLSIGDLVIVNNSQTTGYENGTIGIITRVESIGRLFKLYWVMIPTGENIPMWDEELRLLDGKG